MPWFDKALERVQFNLLDFGFCGVPCLTVEDLILSKIASVHNTKRRFRDLDDLQSVFEAGHDLDLDYLSGQMQVLKLTLPREIKDYMPAALPTISKRILKKIPVCS